MGLMTRALASAQTSDTGGLLRRASEMRTRACEAPTVERRPGGQPRPADPAPRATAQKKKPVTPPRTTMVYALRRQ